MTDTAAGHLFLWTCRQAVIRSLFAFRTRSSVKPCTWIVAQPSPSSRLSAPHHRAWAHQKDPKLPEAPPGAVSGGPNSTLQDPYIRKLGMSGCPPQTCYVDHIESYSTNEVAINWNGALAWYVAFLDDVAHSKK